MRSNNLLGRALADVFAILILLMLPWWAVVAYALSMLWLFDYVEIILIGFLLDLLYGGQYGIISHVLFTLSAYVLFMISMYGKAQMSFYRG